MIRSDVRTDNSTVQAYVNRQGDICSTQLHELFLEPFVVVTRKSVLHQSSLHHGQAVLDLMLCGGPSQSKWKLNPSLIQTIWDKFGRVEGDLFTSQKNVQYTLWFTMSPRDSRPLGTDTAHADRCPKLSYTFSPGPLIPPLFVTGQEFKTPYGEISFCAPAG